MMATVTLNHLWLHDAEDHADFVRVPYADLRATPARRVHIDDFADGGRRARVGPGQWRTVQVGTRLVPWDVGLEVEARVGRRQLVRDARGLVMFATMADATLAPSRTIKHRVSLTMQLHEVSGTVEV